MTQPAEAMVTAASRRTLAEALRSAEHHLGASGVRSPRVDAEVLAAHVLGTDRTLLWRHFDAPVPTGFDELVARRAHRIPLQHLTGAAHFRTVTLSVGPGVFTPRPETELVAGVAIERVRSLTRTSHTAVVVDLCSGSGAIAAAVAAEAPSAEVHAVELDPAAAAWLRQNADRHGFSPHVQDIEGCLPELTGAVDVVVSNPPYIPRGSVPRDPEVARFDPPLALYSGVDGLDHMRVVEQTAKRLLRPGGLVVVEHGDQQGQVVPGVFTAAGGWTDVADHVDLAGRDRFVTALREGA